MTNNNEQAPESNKKEVNRNEQQKESDPAVERGKAAINAARAIDEEPEGVKEEKEEKDAEQWRNEG
jgi:hypothetical protein